MKERKDFMAFESSVAYSALQPHFQERLHLHEPLAKHSSFGVGGPADLWLTIEQQQELHDLVSTCAHQRWPLLVVGAGSNILYADAGVRGIVASMQTQHYHLEEQSEQSALVVAEAACAGSPCSRTCSLSDGLVWNSPSLFPARLGQALLAMLARATSI